MMKAIKIIIFVISFVLLILDCANRVNAETAKSEKVIIYYFQDISEGKKYPYYSYILPDSIAKDFKRREKYIVQTIPVTIPSIDMSTRNREVQRHLRMLAERGKKLSAEYIITGSYMVKEKKIYINTHLFDVKTEKRASFSESSAELGTILIGIIDRLTTGINTELGRFEEYRQKIDYTMSKREFYGILSLSSFGLSALTLGAGFHHFNHKMKVANDNYEDLADQYNTSTSYDEATRLHKEMEHQKELADEFGLVRNILYGVSAATFISGAFFAYKYFKYLTEEKTLKTSRSDTFFFTPLYCYAGADLARINADRDQFIGVMMTWRF